MPRTARAAPGGTVFHVLNRANGRLTLFRKPDDYLAFQTVLVEAHRRVPVRLLDWCVMPKHWHLVLWPRRNGEVTEFLRWLTLTHAQRWKAAHGAVGHGHLYQGRFKSFPIEADESLLTVLRYVQRNPVRAGLVGLAERWRWGSCHARAAGPSELAALLSEWPVDADGKVTTDSGSVSGTGPYDSTYSIVLSGDGRVTAAGVTRAPDSTNDNFALARYLTNGNLDTSFDTDGMLVTDFGFTRSDTGYSIALTPGGWAVVAGTSAGDFALARYSERL